MLERSNKKCYDLLIKNYHEKWSSTQYVIEKISLNTDYGEAQYKVDN